MAGQPSEIDWTHWIYRLIALIIDAVVIAIIAGIIYFLILVPILWTGISVAAPWWGGVFYFPLIQGLFWVLYSAFLDVTWGATIGKRVMGMEVQMLNGGKVEFGKAFIREITKIYWIFLLLDWIVAVVTPGPNRHQRYLDRVAGTTVVQVREPFMASAPPPPPPPPQSA